MIKNIFSKYQNIIPKHFSGEYEDAERILRTIRRLLEFVNLNHMNKSCKLLDLGSGDGSFIKVCKNNGFDAIGIDGSKNNINFENDKLDFKDGVFDVITLISVIEHIEKPENILKEIFRVLKKQGIIVIITPNFRYSYKNFYDDPTHLRPYTDKSIKSLMHLYNFKTYKVVPMLVDKPLLYWKISFSFFFSSILPFKNHQLKKIPFINFLKGKSTAMISVSGKEDV